MSTSPGPARLVSTARRAMWCCVLLVVAVLGAITACAPAPVPHAPPPPAPGTAPRVVPKPVNCARSLTDPSSAQDALTNAKPGDRICVFGQYVQGADLQLTASGTPTQPIVLTSDGSTFASVNISADNVVVEGINTAGGQGIKATGTNITIRNDDVRDASDDGIRCLGCTNFTVENNLVKGADGTGILVSGNGGVVRGNDVSGSVRRQASDADGMRFFGTNIQIENNYVHDISQKGYPPGTEPHTDCFQTYDSDSPTTWGVVISNNRCINVDAQCLIASGTERRNAGVPAGQIAIQFLNNECRTGAVQAVFLESYPNVVIRNNKFEANYDSAVLVSGGAIDVKINDNTLIGQSDPYQIDDSSRPGFDESNNVVR